MIKTTPEQLEELKTAVIEGNVKKNEKLWNFLIGSMLTDSEGREKFVRKFTDDSVKVGNEFDVWYESLPIPPRERTGNTHLDLSFGGIKGRSGTASGIEYDTNGESWVCFVEGKLFSDCSTRVRYDPLRNQLVRVIENLLCFQNDSDFPDELYFTLLTPRLFRDNKRSKLYGYKMQEYRDKHNILKDIRSCRLEKRSREYWGYPEIEERLERLELGWVTYEEILEEEYGLEELDVTDLDEEELEFFKKQMFEKI